MNCPSKDQHFIHVYTGDGKGKTTAALGLILRAVGDGWRVLFVQFLKKGEFSEIKSLKRFGDQVTICQYGSGSFINGKPSEEEMEIARSGLNEIKLAMEKGTYDLIVLDEINVAVHLGLISVKSILNFLEKKPVNVELVFTGRWAPKEIIDRADLVTEMRNIKHYFNKGIKARKGIEK
jgi:cob(I)alamin adenosyltransferase